MITPRRLPYSAASRCSRCCRSTNAQPRRAVIKMMIAALFALAPRSPWAFGCLFGHAAYCGAAVRGFARDARRRTQVVRPPTPLVPLAGAVSGSLRYAVRMVRDAAPRCLLLDGDAGVG